MTTVRRTGRLGHRVKQVTTWCICPPTEPTKEERERITREDDEIQKKREAFPLH